MAMWIDAYRHSEMKKQLQAAVLRVICEEVNCVCYLALERIW